MNDEQLLKIGGWYWITRKDLEGKSFGKILQDVTSEVYLVMLCTVKDDMGLEILDNYFLCKKKILEKNSRGMKKVIMLF